MKPQHLETLEHTISTQRCTAYCTVFAYDLKAVLNYFVSQGIKPVRYHSVVYIPLADIDADIFCFQYGSVVCWGLTEKKEKEILDALMLFQVGTAAATDSEKYDFTYADSAKIFSGTILLPDKDVLKKLAISHGLAQSVKLTTFENIIQETIRKTKKLPEELATKGKIALSRNEISKRMGELFIERSSVNLHSDILDTPEFFWDYEELEPFYKMIINNLDLRLRVEVLNKRLEIVHELFEILGNALEHQHSSTLEWIIIWLIAVEVVLGIARDILPIIFH